MICITKALTFSIGCRRRQDLLEDGLERLDLCLGADVGVDLVLVDLLVASALLSTLSLGLTRVDDTLP